MSFFEKTSEGYRISVKITANAKKNSIVGIYGEFIKMRIAAPPTHHKANKELIRFLSEQFNIPKKNIVIRSGEHSGNKQIFICSKGAIQKIESLLALIPDKKYV